MGDRVSPCSELVAAAIRTHWIHRPTVFRADDDRRELWHFLRESGREGETACVVLTSPGRQCDALAGALRCRLAHVTVCLIYLSQIGGGHHQGDLEIQDVDVIIRAMGSFGTTILILGADCDFIRYGGDLEIVCRTKTSSNHGLFSSLLASRPWAVAELTCPSQALFQSGSATATLERLCRAPLRSDAFLGRTAHIRDTEESFYVRMSDRYTGFRLRRWPTEIGAITRLFAALRVIHFEGNLPHPSPQHRLAQLLADLAETLPDGGANLTLDFDSHFDEHAIKMHPALFSVPSAIGVVTRYLERRAGTLVARPRLDKHKSLIAVFIASVMREAKVDNILYFDEVINCFVERVFVHPELYNSKWDRPEWL